MASCNACLLSFLLINCYLFWISKTDKILYVNQKHGSNEPGCLSTSDSKNHTACRSLDFISSQIGNNSNGITIVIESDLQLDSCVSFVNSTSLNITAREKKRVLLMPSNTEKACGLRFHNVSLAISGITLFGCQYEVNFIDNVTRAVAMHVLQSSNLSIRNVEITNTTGTGLFISDMEGCIEIEDSFFRNNSNKRNATKNNAFAGGIHMQFSKNSERKTSITITNCTFENNIQPYHIHTDPKPSSEPDLYLQYGHGTGGGMGVLFMNTTQEVHILIESCNFTNNTAHSGAGLYLHFEDNTDHNSLKVSNSLFEGNTASTGGGMSIGIGKMKILGNATAAAAVSVNKVYICNTTFTNNTARSGGAISLFAIHSTNFSSDRKGMISFYNCTWKHNKAQTSSAIDISPFSLDHFNLGFLPVPRFTDCTFQQNHITDGKNGKTMYRNFGVVVVTNFEVLFEGTNRFINNEYTALGLISATLLLEENTVTIFDSNHGVKGGGISMYGFSTLKGTDNCSVVFNNNSATQVGGGIYHQPFDHKSFIVGRSCLIQYIGKNYIKFEDVRKRNFSFIFTNNTAFQGGTSIFSVSFYSCFFSHLGNLENHNLSDFFDHIGDFDFSDNPGNSTALATEANLFVIDENEIPNTTIPGKPLHIPLSVVDEFNYSRITPIGLDISTDKHEKDYYYYYFTHNYTRVYSKPFHEVHMTFYTQNSRDAYYNLTVKMQDCPPGYTLGSNADNKPACQCSSDKSDTSYTGINKCNSTLYQAQIEREVWAGYYEKNLYTASCAFQICEINSIPEPFHLLPSDKSKLNKLMCGKYKKGILCGECEKNYSAYFHSSTYKCGSQEKCNYSIIFYILSELVPVVVLFTIIIHFNICFTAGGVSGLVFFSQMVVKTPMDIEKTLYHTSNTTKNWFKALNEGQILIYNILNFDFFSIDELSFCLWTGAKAMDVLAVKYITTIITLILIYSLVRIMNTRWYMNKNKKKKARSVVHGLSAFLILSYSQCALVTFRILGKKIIQSSHAKQRHIKVTHYGGFLYFNDDHLPYAIVALFFLVFFVLLPPLLLLVYPLFLQVLSLCKLSEHRLTQAVLKNSGINRLVPLFDSFQSCFKDKLRFFAGVYFVYKICILMCYSFTKNLNELSATTEFMIFIMLGIHAIMQPYKEKVHNIIDSFLFLNLGLINGLNIYSNYLVTYNTEIEAIVILVMSTTQMILIYAPIVAVVIWLVLKIVKKKQRGKYQKLENFDILEENMSRDDVEPDPLG